MPTRRVLPPMLRVLIVEDNMIIALDAEDMLTRNGVAGVDIAASSTEALRLLADLSYGFAVVDLRLPNAESLAIAWRLQELGIPFIFSVGYGEHVINPPAFPAVPIVGKPFSESYLLARLAALLGEEEGNP
ncbi:MAG: response regulator [Kiloniellaceae bacterium]